MNLYDIKTELIPIQQKLEDWAIEHEGDVSEFPLLDALEGLEMALEDKALSIGVWIKNLLAESKALDDEKKKLDARAKATKAKAERLKAFLQDMVPAGTKYKNTQCVIGWRKSSSVSIEADIDKIPTEYQIIKIEADNKLIKEALKEGKLSFAEIIHKNNIQIK